MPDGGFRTGGPFTIYSKNIQFTERDKENLDLQDGGEELQMLNTFSTRVFRLEIWTAFQNTSFILFLLLWWL